MDSVPRSQVQNKQHRMDWQRHQLAVDKPAIRVFRLHFLTYAAAFEFFAFAVMAYKHTPLYDVLIWSAVCLMPPLGLAAFVAARKYQDFRAEFLEFSEAYFERTQTEYRQVKPSPADTGARDYARNDDGSLKVGKYRYTARQRRQLARLLKQPGDNITHDLFKQIGVLSGDIKSHSNRDKANDMQADLIRIGYAEPNGRATQLTVAGYREWLDHPPTPGEDSGG